MKDTLTWVSALSILPAPDEPVLIYIPSLPVQIGFHDGRRWFTDDGEDVDGQVINWMKLPSPPALN